MAERGLEQLTPDVREYVESYLERLSAGMCKVEDDLVDDVLEESRTHFVESLSADSTLAEARLVADGLGQPDEYAAQLCRALEGSSEETETAPGAGRMAEPSARILGMPADLKAPTGENLRTRVWNPEDSRIFTPRLVGVGWTINFAAIAVRTGIIEPDAEDEAFASVPEGWVWASLALPAAIALALVVAVSLEFGSLPAELPIHWGIDGQPDGFARSSLLFVTTFPLLLAPLAYAAWTFVVSKPKSTRVLTSAFATMFVVLAGSILAVAMLWAGGITVGGWWPWAMVAASFAVPFVMLVVLARVGRAAEIRRDLG